MLCILNVLHCLGEGLHIAILSSSLLITLEWLLQSGKQKYIFLKSNFPFRWVMLTFAWFLAAGMKWSCEAISNYSSYMHAIAWTIPALQTILIMVTNQVDGDPFLGICSVGNNNIEQMHTFILAPLGMR